MVDNLYDLIEMYINDPTHLPEEDVNGVKMTATSDYRYTFEIPFPSNKKYEGVRKYEAFRHFEMDSDFQKGLNDVLKESLGEIGEDYKMEIEHSAITIYTVKSAKEMVDPLLGALGVKKKAPLILRMFSKKARTTELLMDVLGEEEIKTSRFRIVKWSDSVSVLYLFDEKKIPDGLLDNVVGYVQEKMEEAIPDTSGEEKVF